ncbi:uncharacterized protein EV420DRAFT_1641589 [Desarmillaria tabescens]|uniref:Uncharacterized protein n=1 Tax=Armillaria tabescens TaxID=1929756 RepID=A0AA39N7B6_ARMTA|nr:uncharacterized protein EV420DRAFT_1641589 [Desarmillaria tabescens]KAK0460248.1 hypothetical protein EV420DRAFT_1641589 [Desarmillaria tabescens]
MASTFFYAVFSIAFILNVFGHPITISTKSAPQTSRQSMVVPAWEPRDPDYFHLVSLASRVTSGRGRELHSAESFVAARKPFISFGVAGLHHIDPLSGERATSHDARVLNEGNTTNEMLARRATFEVSRKIHDRNLRDDDSEDIKIRADSGKAITFKKVKDRGNATSGDVTINGGGRGSTAVSGNSTTDGGEGGAATSGNVRLNGGGRGSTAVSGDTTGGKGGAATGGDPPETGDAGGNGDASAGNETTTSGNPLKTGEAGGNATSGNATAGYGGDATTGNASAGHGGTATSGNAKILSGTATSGSATSGGVGGNATSGNAITGNGGNATSGDATNNGDGGSATSGDAISGDESPVDGEPTPTSAVQIASSTTSTSTDTTSHSTKAPVIIGSTIGSLTFVVILGFLGFFLRRRKSRYRDDNTSKAESLPTGFRHFSVGTFISSPPSVHPYPFAPNRRCSNSPLPSDAGLPQDVTSTSSRGSYLRRREEERSLAYENPMRSTVEPVETTYGPSPPPSYQSPR